MSRQSSIQKTLTRNVVIVVLVLSLGSGALVFWLVKRALVNQFDAALISQARALVTLIKEEAPGRYEFEFAEKVMPEYMRSHAPEYFQIWNSGAVLERSSSLKEHNLRQIAGKLGHPKSVNMTLPDGRDGRAVGLRFVPQADDEPKEGEGRFGSPLLIVVAKGRKGLDQMLAVVLGTIAASTCLAVVAALLLVPWSIRRGLVSLRRLAKEVSNMGPETLQTRLCDDASSEELQPVYARLNELLERISDSFERERRFSSDVSHELRTPIAEAKTALEMALRWPEDDETVRQSCGAAAEAVEQMERMVNTLLALTRSRMRGVELPRGPLNLRQSVEKIVASLAQTKESRHIDVSLDGAAEATVRTCTSLAESVLRNVIENALVHSPEGSPVRVELAIHDETAAVSVENNAPDLTQDDVEHLFDAFWRKDSARSDPQHLGLGLTLVRSFCEITGAKVCAQLLARQRLRVVVAFGCESEESHEARTASTA